LKFCKNCNTETERYISGQCKSCVKAASNARRIADPCKAKAYKAAWLAKNPDKRKAYRAAYSAYCADNADKIKAYQATYQATYQVAYYAKNADKLRARAAEYRLENPEARRISDQNRRARKRNVGGKLSKNLSVKLFKLQNGKCMCCSLPLGDNYHLDHVMPLALGGSNTDDNMQLLRATCNMQKHAKHPIEFMRQRGFLL
jgi:5-methylcytosine-specific restriction endonuclease McrA